MNNLTSSVSAMMAPLTAQLARSQGWRDGYREGATWTVTLLLDRACDIQDEVSRRVVQGLARELLARLQEQQAATAPSVASTIEGQAVQPVGDGS